MAVYDVLIRYLPQSNECVIVPSNGFIILENKDDSIIFHTLDTDAVIIYAPMDRLGIQNNDVRTRITAPVFLSKNNNVDVRLCSQDLNNDFIVTMTVLCSATGWTPVPLDCTPVIIIRKSGVLLPDCK